MLAQIEDEIKQLRNQMESLALSVGVNHPKVYAISRSIDALHTKWHLVSRAVQSHATHVPKSRLK